MRYISSCGNFTFEAVTINPNPKSYSYSGKISKVYFSCALRKPNVFSGKRERFAIALVEESHDFITVRGFRHRYDKKPSFIGSYRKVL